MQCKSFCRRRHSAMWSRTQQAQQLPSSEHVLLVESVGSGRRMRFPGNHFWFDLERSYSFLFSRGIRVLVRCAPWICTGWDAANPRLNWSTPCQGVVLLALLRCACLMYSASLCRQVLVLHCCRDLPWH